MPPPPLHTTQCPRAAVTENHVRILSMSMRAQVRWKCSVMVGTSKQFSIASYHFTLLGEKTCLRADPLTDHRSLYLVKISDTAITERAAGPSYASQLLNLMPSSYGTIPATITRDSY